MKRRAALLAFGILSLAVEAAAQVGPRIVVVADTSSSMTAAIADGRPTGTDGAHRYFDPSLSGELVSYPGLGGATCGAACCLPSLPTTPSRMAAQARALQLVATTSIAGAEYALVRQTTGTACTIRNTVSPIVGNTTTCTSDLDCEAGRFCFIRAGDSTRTRRCYAVDNLCVATTGPFDYARGGGAGLCAAEDRGLPVTWWGSCSPALAASAPECRAPQTCVADADCSGTASGRCAVRAPLVAPVCVCGTAGTSCPFGFVCDAGRCVANAACQSGGSLLSGGFTTTGMFPWLDGYESYGPGGTTVNPELRAHGESSMSGPIRYATSLYTSTVAVDPARACRPYSAIVLSADDEACDPSRPMNAVHGFVAATASGSASVNELYVIGLGATSPQLDAMARVGRTAEGGAAMSATSELELVVRLSRATALSVARELCNGADDDCNGACDEPFPGVAITSASCSNRRAALACDNGQRVGTHCFATGVVVCSAAGDAQVCSAPTCATNPSLCPSVETCNAMDDDCDGSVDEGVALPETCNRLDDDCDGATDESLAVATCGVGACARVGTGCGMCTPGVPSTEICNGADDDCDGDVDEGCDDDGDAFCDPGMAVAAGAACVIGDCDDGDSTVSPARVERCNGADDDCDGRIDDGLSGCAT